MEIRQLRYFLSAVRRGSLRAAARDHFVTQPAVSIQLKKLEEEVGEKLYFRAGKRIVPTQAGDLLIPQIEEVLQRIDLLKESVQGLRGLEHGRLKLGNIDAASIYVLPGVFRLFRRRYPGVDIQVVVADSDSLLDALDVGEVELAIVTLPLARDNIEVMPFYEDVMVLVASPRHDLVTDRALRRNPLEAAAETGLISYPAGSTTRRLIESVFIDNGLDFRAAMEMSSPEAIKRLTETGLGASILPLKIVSNEVRRGTLRVIPTGKVRFQRTLGVVYKTKEILSQPAQVFLRMLLDKHSR
jgi:DNA-binding transcriptional LysR family regulator